MEEKEFCGISVLFDGVCYEINGEKERVHELLEWISSNNCQTDEEGILFRYY